MSHACFKFGAAMLAVLCSAAAPAATLSVAHSFDAGQCNLPQGSLLRTADGSLYGTCFSGGANRAGILYRLAPDGAFSLLHEFSYVSATDASEPGPGPMLASDGRIWGSASGGGGENSSGALYSISTDGSGFQLNAVFSADATGVFPSPLLQTADGSFYGITNQGGGRGGRGTLFRYSAGAGLVKVITFRSPRDAVFPTAGLTLGADGLLYGTANSGISSDTAGNEGTLFRIRQDGSGYQRLLGFQRATHGAFPTGELLLAADGNFYGVTTQGGPLGGGTVYRYTPAGQFTLLHAFSGAASDGAWPNGGLAQGADGALYGVTLHGGTGGSADVGTVYRVALDGSFTQLHSFDTTSPAGYAPYDRLTPAPDGSLYGTTWHGPAGASGTVFRIQP
ncbi:hypothetical protein LRH25_15220 [Ideonella azotifigens]|uniref:Uncharacterized protein n=2 Tax=Ideonella azotifigens TaxID=513160 RepID=A0ABP3V8K9_9BURK|nr:choice-of-anchor tandem repeat GloVer-containing protein [Ideonella azotifigens]MCD2341694.1 hypothetical protein [Ideonella azotifigens]